MVRRACHTILVLLTIFSKVQSVPVLGAEPVETTDDDRYRGILGFINTLNTLGNLVNVRPSASTGIKDVANTTPRLSGRPGLGFIPDVSKGIDTILRGVATGNLEKVLEGSFVFAPNGVQLVAGNVLDRVFLSTTPSSTILTTPSGPASTQRSQTSEEAQLILWKIIQEQQQQIENLQAGIPSSPSTGTNRPVQSNVD